MPEEETKRARQQFALLQELELRGQFELTQKELVEALGAAKIQPVELQRMVIEKVICPKKSGPNRRATYEVVNAQQAYVAHSGRESARFGTAWRDIRDNMPRLMRTQGESFFIEELGQLVIARLFAIVPK
jgi:hypothetical protein